MGQPEKASLLGTILSLTGTNTLGLVLGAITWIVAARLFTVEEIGLTAAIVGTCTFLGTGSVLGLDHTMVRYAASGSPRRRRALVTGSLALAPTLAIALTIMVSPILLHPSTAEAAVRSPMFTLLLALSAWGICSGAIGDSAFLAAGDPRAIVIRNLAVGLVRLLSVGLVGGLNLSIPLYGAYLAPWLVGGLLAVVQLGRRRFLAVSRLGLGLRELRRVSRYAVGSYVGSGLDAAALGLLPLIVLIVAGSRVAGLFYIAWLIATILFVFPTGIARAVFAHDAGHRLASVTRRRTVFWSITGSMAIAVFVAGLAPIIVQVFGPQYLAAAGALTWLAASLPVIAYSSLRISRLRLGNAVSSVALASLVHLAVLLAVAAWLASDAGQTGAAVAWFVAQLTLAVVVTVIERSATRFALAPRGFRTQ